MRALALDRDNPLISFSVGLGYIHYALKRQCSNRQYLITQGLSFIFRYFHVGVNSNNQEERRTAYFDVARTFHLLGLQDVADRYYHQVRAMGSASGLDNASTTSDLTLYTAFNQWCSLVATGNLVASRKLMYESLRL